MLFFLWDVRIWFEVGEMLWNKFVCFMIYLDIDVKRVVVEFLFVLCFESVF